MEFSLDPKKQAIEICFSPKIVRNNTSPLSLNQSQAKVSESHKDLGLILDTKLKFNEHLEDIINKYNRIIGSIKKSLILFNLIRIWPEKLLFWGSHVSSVRSHLDYADIIYDESDNEFFKEF